MSRGGRRGFSSRGRGGKQRIGGQEVSWDYDPELEVDNKPQELFPKIEVPSARRPTRAERAQVECYKAFRQRIHDGPLFTVLGDDVRISKPGAKPAKIQIDPFEDMPSYTQKYKPPSRTLPTFSTKPYDLLKFFPKELWSTVDPKAHLPHGDGVGAANGSAGRAGRSQRRHQLPAEDDEDEDADKKGKGANENAELVDDDDDDASSEKNPEDDFSDDDSDMGADYNAEGYFDAGDDDLDTGNMEAGDDGGFD